MGSTLFIIRWCSSWNPHFIGGFQVATCNCQRVSTISQSPIELEYFEMGKVVSLKDLILGYPHWHGQSSIPFKSARNQRHANVMHLQWEGLGQDRHERGLKEKMRQLFLIRFSTQVQGLTVNLWWTNIDMEHVLLYLCHWWICVN